MYKRKVYQDLLNVKTVVLTWKFRIHILRSRDKILGKYLCFPDLHFLPLLQLSIISQCKTWDFGLDGSLSWMAVLFFFPPLRKVMDKTIFACVMDFIYFFFF